MNATAMTGAASAVPVDPDGDIDFDALAEPPSEKPDPVAARRATDEAIARVEVHADDEWKKAALDAIELVCRTRRTFTGDDIWQTGLPRPREPRALGAIMRRAAGKGWCRKTGRQVSSQMPRNHRALHAEWESLLPTTSDDSDTTIDLH